MNDHLRVLQQRIQSVAVGSRDEAHHATCPGRSQSLERALHEIVQRKKEELHTGHDHADIRHQLAILIAVSDQYGENVDGQEEAPKQQRALHPRPQRCNFIKRGKVPVTVGDHVGTGKIVGEKQIFEA